MSLAVSFGIKDFFDLVPQAIDKEYKVESNILESRAKASRNDMTFLQNQYYYLSIHQIDVYMQY